MLEAVQFPGPLPTAFARASLVTLLLGGGAQLIYMWSVRAPSYGSTLASRESLATPRDNSALKRILTDQLSVSYNNDYRTIITITFYHILTI